MKTLLLIDNQDITREGMKTVAGRIGGFAAIKEAGSQSELRLSLKPWGIALKFLFLHHENILFPND